MTKLSVKRFHKKKFGSFEPEFSRRKNKFFMMKHFREQKKEGTGGDEHIVQILQRFDFTNLKPRSKLFSMIDKFSERNMVHPVSFHDFI